MIVTAANLEAIRVGFKSNFNTGLGVAVSQAALIASEVPSSGPKERYGWLGNLPGVREWIGDRVIQNLAEAEYEIINRDWELTLGVDRNHIQDDNLGIYAPLFTEMGRSTGAHKDELVFGLLKTGFTVKCFDAQPYFSTDHPVKDKNGKETKYANTDGGAGTPWFLMVTGRALKPLIYQNRKPWTFVARDNPDHQNVFSKKEFQYGADARGAAGFGFPQMCWGSKQTLNAANYAKARAAIMAMTGDYGRPLGLVPDTLVVPPGLEADALKLLNAEYGTGGETNPWKGTAKPLVVPWLA